MSRHFPIALLAPVFVAACVMPRPVAQPGWIAALQARRIAQPADREVALALAEAHYQSGRADSAFGLLEEVLAAEPGNQEAALFRAFCLDELRRDGDARVAYERLRQHVSSGAVRHAIDSRLAVLAYRARNAEAAAIASGEVTAPAPSADVAVLPFGYTASDTSLVPIRYSLAQLVADDMARAETLTIVDYARSRNVARRMGLTGDTVPSAAAAARLGRLLGATTVVVGVVEDGAEPGSIRIRTTLVDVASGATRDVVAAEGRLTVLPRLEVLVVQALVDSLGAALPADVLREPVRRQRNLGGIAPFGRGIAALDRGDFTAAANAMNDAARMSRSWASVRAARDEAALLAASITASPILLAGRVNGPTRQALVRARLHASLAGAAPIAGDLRDLSPGDPDRSVNRKPLSEATVTDGPERAARGARVVITVRPN